MNTIFCYHPIGIIYSEHTNPETGPVQPCYAQDSRGKVEIFPEYAEGLKDLEGYSHIYLFYHFHKAKPVQLIVKPFIQNTERGLFSTRVPGRPNPIGLSIVRLLSRQDNILMIEGADVLNETPLLDIKPYSHRIDCIQNTCDGWQGEVSDKQAFLLGSRQK